ncbi:SMI1/KNR4 family protein [Lacinutrix salivirga]
MKYLNKIVTQLDKWETIYKGCSQNQIKEIEELAVSKLPECYVEFLEVMGFEMDRKAPGMRGYLLGTTVFYPSIKWLNETWAEQLTEDGSSLELPENAFVFYDHQGYLFAFFKLDEGDNPPVYGYEEGYEGDSFPKIADSLSSFYERHLEGDKTLFSELRV